MRNQADASDPLGSEKAGLRALSLSVIRSIVEQHKGRVENDQLSDFVDISIPHDEEAACAQRIGEQMGSICRHIYALVDAFMDGELPIWFENN